MENPTWVITWSDPGDEDEPTAHHVRQYAEQPEKPEKPPANDGRAGHPLVPARSREYVQGGVLSAPTKVGVAGGARPGCDWRDAGEGT